MPNLAVSPDTDSSCKINRGKRGLEVIMSFMLQQQCQGWFGSHNCVDTVWAGLFVGAAQSCVP